jgi:predicted phosphodiesterase
MFQGVRLAIISDIHEDLSMLHKVLKKTDKKGFDKLICLGDISGYSESYYRYPKSRNAPACLELVREKCSIIVPGNHDHFAAGKIPEQVDGKENEYWQHEQDLDPGYSTEQISFLKSLPEFHILNTGREKILFTHYLEPNLSGYIKGFYTRAREIGQHFQLMQENMCSLGFTGHAHIRGFYTVKPSSFRQYSYRKLYLKEFPLIIGIPPVTRHKYRSGFCIFDTDSRLLQVFKLY